MQHQGLSRYSRALHIRRHGGTDHVDIRVGFNAAWPREFSDSHADFVTIDGVRRPAFIDRNLRLTVFSPAVTYQFFKNSFAHPYVTGGLRVGVLQEHRLRGDTASSYRSMPLRAENLISYAVPPIDDRRTTVLARPFVGVGCKSYFNSRRFLRTEALIARGPIGTSQFTLHIGAGVDF